MKEEELLTNKEIRNKNLDRVEVLEKVKDLILLGNTEYATTRQVAEYFDVDESVITMCCQNNKEELKDNGLLILTGKKTKEKLVNKNNLVTNLRGHFMIFGETFANKSNRLFTKRTILNVAMLLRDSSVAKEIRRRLLDMAYEVDSGNKDVKETIINDLDEEHKLMLEMVEAQINGDLNKVNIINTKLFALKNKRIKDLEDEVETISTHALTIIDSRAVINRLARKIASERYNGRFSSVYSEAYKTLNYKLHINVNARDRNKGQRILDVLTQEETFELEKEMRAWANRIGIDVDNFLSLDKVMEDK